MLCSLAAPSTQHRVWHTEVNICLMTVLRRELKAALKDRKGSQAQPEGDHTLPFQVGSQSQQCQHQRPLGASEQCATSGPSGPAESESAF